MKKMNWIMVLWLAWMPMLSIWASEGQYAVRIRLSKIQSESGLYNDQVHMKDLMKSALFYGGGIQWPLMDHFAVELGLDYGWMGVREPYPPQLTKKSVLELPIFYISNVIFYPLYRGRLYFRSGIGFVPWRFTTSGRRSDVIRIDNENFEKFTMSLHAGIGYELQLIGKFSLFGEGLYHFILSEHQFSFNPDFSNQGIFQIGGGFMFYFKRK